MRSWLLYFWCGFGGLLMLLAAVGVLAGRGVEVGVLALFGAAVTGVSLGAIASLRAQENRIAELEARLMRCDERIEPT